MLSLIFQQVCSLLLQLSNPDINVSQISKLISHTFKKLSKDGIDTDKIWTEIDHAISLSLLSGVGDLVRGLKGIFSPQNNDINSNNDININIINRKDYFYPKCFQILGFDILLDEKLKPWVLEINYRPSLHCYQTEERKMKVGMIKDSLKIAAPLEHIQGIILSKKLGWNDNSWNSFLLSNPHILDQMKNSSETALKLSKYIKILPSEGKYKNVYQEIEKKVLSLPEINLYKDIQSYINQNMK